MSLQASINGLRKLLCGVACLGALAYAPNSLAAGEGTFAVKMLTPEVAAIAGKKVRR